MTSQLPIEHWHAWLNEPTVADAILDRLVHRAHQIALKGESLRRKLQEKSRIADPSCQAGGQQQGRHEQDGHHEQVAVRCVTHTSNLAVALSEALAVPRIRPGATL